MPEACDFVFSHVTNRRFIWALQKRSTTFLIWMELLTGTVPVNNSLLTGTVPVNNSLLTGTWSLSIIPYWQGPYNIVYGVYFTLDLDWLAKINYRLTRFFLNLSPLCPISWPPLLLHNWVSICVDKTCSADHKVDLKANIKTPKQNLCYKTWMLWTPFVKGYFATLHLGFSVKLRIWQVPACKMEPQSGIIL